MTNRPCIRTARCIGGHMIFCLMVALCVSPRLVAQPGNPAQTPPATQNKAGDQMNQKIAGLSVIVKIEPVAGESLFHADGYRIRIATPGTTTAFNGSLKSLADVTPGTWIRFEGVRDDTGVLVARMAEFFSPGTRKTFVSMGPTKATHVPDYQPVTHESLLDAEGHFVDVHAKVRYSDAGGPCGWHRVPADLALQERVQRVGIRLVPEYQKQLPLDSPSRIPFRFYVVADDKIRSVFACNEGLVLVPRNVVERFHNDDQLAAVLADGVAFHLHRQLAATPAAQFAAGAVETALFLMPAWYVPGEVAWGIASHVELVKLERECGRMALQLTADAGYDPWQAPEAWRLLGPKKPPTDPQSLKYTREGQYQLDILKLQYKRTELRGSASTGRSAATD